MSENVLKLTEAEKAELLDLQAKLLKKDGSPRKDASAGDLARLEDLEGRLPDDDNDAGAKPVTVTNEPLDAGELKKLCRLETGCLNAEPYPGPRAMAELAVLRARCKVKLATHRCSKCQKQYVTIDNAGETCPFCIKTQK